MSDDVKGVDWLAPENQKRFAGKYEPSVWEKISVGAANFGDEILGGLPDIALRNLAGKYDWAKNLVDKYDKIGANTTADDWGGAAGFAGSFLTGTGLLKAAKLGKAGKVLKAADAVSSGKAAASGVGKLAAKVGGSAGKKLDDVIRKNIQRTVIKQGDDVAKMVARGLAGGALEAGTRAATHLATGGGWDKAGKELGAGAVGGAVLGPLAAKLVGSDAERIRAKADARMGAVDSRFDFGLTKAKAGQIGGKKIKAVKDAASELSRKADAVVKADKNLDRDDVLNSLLARKEADLGRRYDDIYKKMDAAGDSAKLQQMILNGVLDDFNDRGFGSEIIDAAKQLQHGIDRKHSTIGLKGTATSMMKSKNANVKLLGGAFKDALNERAKKFEPGGITEIDKDYAAFKALEQGFLRKTGKEALESPNLVGSGEPLGDISSLLGKGDIKGALATRIVAPVLVGADKVINKHGQKGLAKLGSKRADWLGKGAGAALDGYKGYADRVARITAKVANDESGEVTDDELKNDDGFDSGDGFTAGFKPRPIFVNGVEFSPREKIFYNLLKPRYNRAKKYFESIGKRLIPYEEVIKNYSEAGAFNNFDDSMNRLGQRSKTIETFKKNLDLINRIDSVDTENKIKDIVKRHEGSGGSWGWVKSSFSPATRAERAKLKADIYSMSKDILGVNFGSALTEQELELALDSIANPSAARSNEAFEDMLRTAIENKRNELILENDSAVK